MFGVNSINGSVKWLSVTEFLRTDGPPWTDNLLATSHSQVYGGAITNNNWGSQPCGPYGSVFVLWSGPFHVMPAYIHKIPENARDASMTIYFEAGVWCACKVPLPATTPSAILRVNRKDDYWEGLVNQ